MKKPHCLSAWVMNATVGLVITACGAEPESNGTGAHSGGSGIGGSSGSSGIGGSSGSSGIGGSSGSSGIGGSSGSSGGGGSGGETFVAKHWVTESGDGLGDGSSLVNAMSAESFNALSGAYANEVFYFSGPFDTRVTVTGIEGSSSGHVVLDGLESGDCNPVADRGCAGAAYMQRGIDIGAADSGPDDLAVQDFNLTSPSTANYAALRIYSDVNNSDDDLSNCDRILVQRNWIHDTGGEFFLFYKGRNLIVQDNLMENYWFNTAVDLSKGINFIRAKNVLFRRNLVRNDNDGACSSGGGACDGADNSAELIELHGCNQMLMEYNDLSGAIDQSGIRPKEDGVSMSEIVIRYNHVHHNLNPASGKGIYARTAYHLGADDKITDIFIYGNYVHDNGNVGIMFGTGMEGTLYVGGNIIADNGNVGFDVWQTADGTLYLVNNTIVGNNTSGSSETARGGIVMPAEVVGGENIFNNVLAHNRPSDTKHNQCAFYKPILALDYNTYHHPSSAPDFYYDGAWQTLDDMRTAYSLELHGTLEDPLFADYANHDYRLASGSPCLANGRDFSLAPHTVDLSGGDAWFESVSGYDDIAITFNEGLSPSSDLTAFPSPSTYVPASHAAKRARGAFVSDE